MPRGQPASPAPITDIEHIFCEGACCAALGCTTRPFTKNVETIPLWPAVFVMLALRPLQAHGIRNEI